jgi:integrase/recombinase XerC
MTHTGADMHTMTLEKGLATFLNALSGKNRSTATIRAYQTDISQLIVFLHANNVSIQTPADVGKVDVVEYLSALAKRELTGIARARKMSAIREYFRFLEGIGVIQKSPTTGIDTPKREKNGRQVLRSDEYTKMLSLAGAHPRDYAILQVFLQTGIRVSELASLTKDAIDFVKPSITVRGKGSVEREIFLEKKGVHALKSYLAVRGESCSSKVFLNYQGEPISERGIRKLVVKYRQEAGITKKASCHTFRHTFATCKAEKGVPAYQLQQWLGHANLTTTQIYIHLGKQNARKIMQDTSI